MSALVVSESSPPVEALIAKAIEHGISVEGLERLLTMRERLKAEAARAAFFEALSAFQAGCPIVPKRKVARIESSKGSYTYRYAPLEDIVQAVSPRLASHGLSYTIQAAFEAAPQPAQVVTCTVHHLAGHSESSEFRAPIDAGARMNLIQQNAAALTYAKRYAFCNALGILTGEEDIDARGTSEAGGERTAGATRTGTREVQATDSDMGQLRELNERLGDGKWSPAILKARASRPNGFEVTKAELEGLLANQARPAGPPEQESFV